MLSTDTPIQEVHTEFLVKHQVQLFIKRDDQIHPFISGNKWRKLKYNIESFYSSGKTQIVTFGGAFSNHLIATACACAMNKIPCIGVVRGEELQVISNYVLRLCSEFGMKFQFVSRLDYRDKESLYQSYESETNFVIPEGGDNDLGIKGCEEIVDSNRQFENIFVGVGTGTTFTGIIRKAHPDTMVHGVAALNQAEYLIDHILQKTNKSNFKLHTNYAFGGFGKYDDKQLEFNREFAAETGVLLDPIYTGKVVRGLYDLIQSGSIKPGAKILFVHTGGFTGMLSDKWLKSKAKK